MRSPRTVALALVLVLALGAGCTARVDAYHANGVKRFEGHASRLSGARQGLWTYWYASGLVRERGTYADDRREGTWTRWHANGQRESRGRRAYCPATGGCERVGEWTAWYPDGRLQWRGTFDAQGRRDGAWTAWDRTGAVDAEESGTWEHGVRRP